MPACKDPQHERFCIELVEERLRVPPRSKPEYDAYVRAGYAPHRGNAHRLARLPVIVERVNELMEEAREWLDIRLIKVLMRLDRVADAKLSDFYESVMIGDREVVRLKNITSLPARLTEALEAVEYDDDGSIKKIKLHDKLAANATLLKHLTGTLAERPAAQVNIFNALSAEDQRVLAEALESLPAPTIEAEREDAG